MRTFFFILAERQKALEQRHRNKHQDRIHFSISFDVLDSCHRHCYNGTSAKQPEDWTSRREPSRKLTLLEDSASLSTKRIGTSCSRLLVTSLSLAVIYGLDEKISDERFVDVLSVKLSWWVYLAGTFLHRNNGFLSVWFRFWSCFNKVHHATFVVKEFYRRILYFLSLSFKHWIYSNHGN